MGQEASVSFLISGPVRSVQVGHIEFIIHLMPDVVEDILTLGVRTVIEESLELDRSNFAALDFNLLHPVMGAKEDVLSILIGLQDTCPDFLQEHFRSILLQVVFPEVVTILKRGEIVQHIPFLGKHGICHVRRIHRQTDNTVEAVGKVELQGFYLLFLILIGIFLVLFLLTVLLVFFLFSLFFCFLFGFFSFFQQGEYVDMCIGPHLTYTKALKAFKITQQSGAYWKNDKENKMLTRINGVAFHNQEELEAWEKEQQEARERDHRKIGKEMGLFMTDDLVGRGLPMFLPAGYTVWQELENYIKEKERARGYLHVMTPCIGTVNLYKTSGHWDHYRENMFPAMEMEGESYVLRPMNCPHHMMIYANRPHSYRDLPMRIGEIAHDFRYESSGTLKGIERGRHFCQNDAHLFCTPEQIKSEVANVCDLIFEVYKDFNITDYRCVLSLRDPADKKKYHDDDAMWNHAEQALREVLTELGIHFTEEIGEAAFYGPKLDVNVKPAVGAEYTLSTCQLDFCLPAKFHLTYVDKDGSEKTPVVLHRAILGSLDRFMAYLIEETKGKFPTWLAPTQVKVLPVSEKTLEYAQDVTEKLSDAGIRVVLDDDNQKIGYKIRAAQQVDRVPYMLVLGAKEAEAGNVSVRDRKGETTTMDLDAFINQVVDEIKTRKNNG